MKRVSALIMMTLLIMAVSLSGTERKRATVMTWYVAPGNSEVKTEELRRFAVESGGYISYFSGSQVKLKVPFPKLGALKELLEQGAYILDSQVRHKDLTTKLMDLNTRLETKNKLLKELSALFAGSKFHQTIEIEREMGRVVFELEKLKGQIRYYEELTSLVDVSVYYRGRRGRRFSIPQQFYWMQKLGVKNMIRSWEQK